MPRACVLFWSLVGGFLRNHQGLFIVFKSDDGVIVKHVKKFISFCFTNLFRGFLVIYDENKHVVKDKQ